MLISIYQSDLFNKWLAKRVEMSDGKFKLLDGEVMKSLDDLKFFTPNKINEKIIKDFEDKKIVPTGLLCGREVYRARNEAQLIEKEFDDTYIQEKGLRRDAIIFPKDIFVNYDVENKKCKLKFTLPKASYATVVVENIANQNLRV
jgi:tRNA pseudouridine13 synthase